jgi:IclR family pca regulon transcriptional regulator
MLQRRDTIEGLAKGLAVLECFSPQRQRLNATLVAQRAGLSRAAARRQLLTLEHLGYLEAEGGWYWLAPKVLRLAGSYLASARLPRLLQPMLDRLAADTGEACSATLLDAHEVVIVARALPRDAPPAPAIAAGLHQGARVAAHATSTGRVLLAALPARALAQWLRQHAPLPRLTARTVTDPKALRALLAAVREADHCVASEEHELGVHAVAVPVRRGDGAVVAAVNLVVQPSRLHEAVLARELLPAMRAAAGSVRPLL